MQYEIVIAQRPDQAFQSDEGAPVEERPDIASRKREHEDDGNRDAVCRLLGVLNVHET